MLELILCSMLTVLPDYLFRRYGQGKRWGHEINFFSMWYELRWGITACMLLTISLITLIFYYHPATTNATPFFRTVTMLPEGGGRVEEVFIKNKQLVEAGDALFSLQNTTQSTAVDTARGKIAEVEAAFAVSESELAASAGLVDQAKGALDQASNELRMKKELKSKGANLVSNREVERLENTVSSRQGALAAAIASEEAVNAHLTIVLPSQKFSAMDALKQAEAELEKTVVYAGVSGRVQQFFLRPGDYVNPILRPAGILIPTEGAESGTHLVQAGFSQLAVPVIHPGTLAEITCLSKPFTIIPMVVTEVQDVIVSGQLRPTDVLIDIQDRAKPGSFMVVLEPLYSNGLEGVLPGTKCIANAYTSNHDLIASGDLGMSEMLFLHLVDTVGAVHAIILRIQTLMLPVQMLVFSGH